MRALWTLIGVLALALGIIGIALPLLPTTPFVLLAAFAFAKGAPRARRWLTGHRVFGPMIHEWETHHAIAPRYKLVACVLMAASIVASVVAGVSPLLIVIQLSCITLAALYILTRANPPADDGDNRT